MRVNLLVYMALLGQASAIETLRKIQLENSSSQRAQNQVRAVGAEDDNDTGASAVVEEIKAKVAKEQKEQEVKIQKVRDDNLKAEKEKQR